MENLQSCPIVFWPGASQAPVLSADRKAMHLRLQLGLIKHTDFVYRCLSHGQLEDFYSLGKERCVLDLVLVQLL